MPPPPPPHTGKAERGKTGEEGGRRTREDSKGRKKHSQGSAKDVPGSGGRQKVPRRLQHVCLLCYAAYEFWYPVHHPYEVEVQVGE